ncbi:P-loop NTPase family protein [Streptomyces uncialis]|uniref:kinase n=1 Tax=Streptomyces uncialis TaxID=1048205 RepID=UPI002E361C09|nr:kinase [Streptomyces uncialis]
MTTASRAQLIVLRGNSATSKTSVAAGARERYGRGVAVVGQDTLRRDILRERDIPGGVNVGLVGLTARYALEHGFHTVLEAILYVGHYGDLLAGLLPEHPSAATAPTSASRSSRPWNGTRPKPIASEVGEAQLSEWYRPLDLLPGGVETIISATSALDETADRVLRASGLTAHPSAPNAVDGSAGTATAPRAEPRCGDDSRTGRITRSLRPWPQGERLAG